MCHGTRWVVMALMMIVWSQTDGLAQRVRPRPDTLVEAIHAIENLDALRSGLAGRFARKDVAVDKSTFKDKRSE